MWADLALALANLGDSCDFCVEDLSMKPKKPMACTICMTADVEKLIKRKGQPIRMCRKCKSTETIVAHERKKRLATGSRF